MDAVLRVVVGSITPGNDARPTKYMEYAHNTLPVSLAPREKKSLTCEIRMPSRTLRANDTQIEVESFAASGR